MSAGRLRTGELLALAGGLVLLVTLFLSWFELDAAGSADRGYEGLDLPATGFAQLGWFVVAVVALTLALLAWMTLAAARRAAGPAVMSTVLTVTAAAFAFALLGLRLAIDQPDLGADLPSSAVGVEIPAYIGLAASALVLAGSWFALADERLDAPESAFAPPPPRPAPPAEEGETRPVV